MAKDGLLFREGAELSAKGLLLFLTNELQVLE